MADFTTRLVVMPRLRPEEFQKIRELAYEKFGLELKPGKEELVLSRLGRKLREGGFSSFTEYYDHVVSDPSGESLIALIDALTTNFTSFFREAEHFEFLRSHVLPTLRSNEEIRIWCAAAATGEEPYSIAFTLLEALGASALNRIRIVATDISTRALTTAARAIYPEDRFAQMPTALRQRYLQRGRDSAAGYYRVRPEIRKRIEFRRLNLVEQFRHDRPFPVIFCRNVMIYFNRETRDAVVTRMLEWLTPGGHLFVGHAESLGTRDFPLRYLRPAVYQKNAAASMKSPGRGGRR